jgi:predicted DNA-binding mobile mystery protein A
MNNAIRHLDKRFHLLRPLVANPRPPKGWLRAVRDALGMTTGQLARRLGVSQPRVVQLEKAEIDGSLTLNTLERVAAALGCRFVYAIIPEHSLAETVQAQAKSVADRRFSAVEHTMSLENQAVQSKTARDEQRRQLLDDLLRHPARLWDEK